jgi:hypothetical protein
MASQPQVDRRHPEYTGMADRWHRCRTFCEGRDAVKAEETAFLPQPGGLDSEEYLAYLMRTPFYNASGAALEMLSGVMTRKPPEVTALQVPIPGLSGPKFSDDIDRSGTGIEPFLDSLATEFILTGRVGVLVDHTPKDQPQGRPYLAAYPAESIINWWTTIENGRQVLQWVVLEEVQDEPDPLDRYKLDSNVQWRVLEIDQNGNYIQSIWVRNKGGGRFKQIDLIQPTINDVPLREIPFTLCTPFGRTWTVQPPPILPVVDLNWDWYMRAADLAHMMHLTTCPMAWASAQGLSPSSTDAEGRPLVIRMGSSRLLTLPEGGRCGMLEVTGAAAQQSRELLGDLEDQMAQLGVAMLMPEKRQPEVALSMRMKISSRTIRLARLAKQLSSALTTSSRTLLAWAGVPDATAKQAIVSVNDDFLDIAIDPAEMQALLLLHQAGKLPTEILFWNLEHGERIPPGWTLEKYLAAVKEEEAKALLAAKRLADSAGAKGKGDGGNPGDPAVPKQ